MVKRELNNNKYKGLTGVIYRKMIKIAKTDMGTFCGIDKRYIALYGYFIAITMGYIGTLLLSFLIFMSIASTLIRIIMWK